MGRVELSGGFRAEDFAPDGSLRDVCVLGVDLPVWERLLRAALKSPWDCRFELNDKPCPLAEFSAPDFFAAKEKGEDVSARLSIQVGELWFDCFLFEATEIEFSFDPSEIADGRHFGALEKFMIWLAEACDRRVIMTMESTHHDDIPPLLETVRRQASPS